MNEESREIRNMRHMAWERAKGELRSISHTYWDNKEKFNDYEALLGDFIKDVERNGTTE